MTAQPCGCPTRMPEHHLFRPDAAQRSASGRRRVTRPPGQGMRSWRLPACAGFATTGASTNLRRVSKDRPRVWRCPVGIAVARESAGVRIESPSAAPRRNTTRSRFMMVVPCEDQVVDEMDIGWLAQRELGRGGDDGHRRGERLSIWIQRIGRRVERVHDGGNECGRGDLHEEGRHQVGRKRVDVYSRGRLCVGRRLR